MKWILAILLVVNVLFFTVMRLASNHGVDPQQEHEPVKAEIIKLLAEPVKKPESIEKSGEATGMVKSDACLDWGDFSGNEMKRAAQALDKLQLGSKPMQHKAEKLKGFWVYIPPRKTLLDAQNKMTELKDLGISDPFIIRDGLKWKHAISLGVFPTAESATKHLEQLRAKGVKSAVSGPRSQEVDAIAFQIKDVSDSMATLTRLKSDFPGSELKAVECRKPDGAK
ncbi:MAG: SPOR domain-containing protein [Betaproteobacteria bacterium]|nr:SPOR domain-containing protein [Betaproteobacteria bacterium]